MSRDLEWQLQKKYKNFILKKGGVELDRSSKWLFTQYRLNHSK